MNFSFSFEAIGTHWTIDIYKELDVTQQERIQALIHSRIAEFDVHYSRFRSDSLVSKIAEHSGVYDLPEDAQHMIELYKKMYHLTDGLMTPLIGQLISDAGYNKDYSLHEADNLSTTHRWEDVIEYPFRNNSRKINVKQPALLDFGALGKGYLIDIVSQLLQREGYTEYCVDAGGDINYRRQLKPLKIGLENPSNTSQVIGIAELVSGGFAGSAGNRRAWGRFNHILNPETKASPHHIHAVWAVAETTMLADALTTALYFTKPEVLKTQFNFEYVILYADQSVEVSKGFPGTLFT